MRTFYDTYQVIKIISLIASCVLLLLSIRNLVICLRQVKKKVNVILSSLLHFIVLCFNIVLVTIYEASLNEIKTDEWMTKPTFFMISMCWCLLAIWIMIDSILLDKYLNSHLSEKSIKESIDELPTGICYYNENGLILLSNYTMNEDAISMIGVRLLNGLEFWKMLTTPTINENYEVQVKENETFVIFKSGIVKNYKRYLHLFKNQHIYEIISSDITKEYHLYEKYKEKKEKLQLMNEDLRKYGKEVGKLTIEKEILQTKIKIHNDFGKLLLQTKLAIENNKEKKEIYQMWDETIRLFGIKEETKDETNKIKDLIFAAKEIGVIVNYTGYFPMLGSIEEKIISNAMHVCITNTVLHAKGSVISIDSNLTNDKLEVTFENNGECPKKDAKEGGGLSSLRTIVEKERGNMEITWIPQFKLKIVLNHKMERR